MQQNHGKYSTMIFGIITLITALAISAVAIYYSVAGLMAIFAAAALPIMIMGGTLEVAKLVTAVWLHKFWDQATWWIKTYLVTAVVVLMFITSMGIFGFLSKAHIEQTSASEESIARVDTIQKELDRQDVLIARAEDRIVQLEDTDSGVDAGIQQQIDTEQTRIDSAYTRIQPAIAEQNVIIANVTALFQSELDNIDVELDKLQSYIEAGDIAKAQGMIGSKADGEYGPKTAQAFTDFQEVKKVERSEWIQKLQDAAQSPTVIAARAEITRLRGRAEQQIANSNTLINRLRTQLGNTTTADTVQGDIDAQQARITAAAAATDALTEEKIQLEAEYRKLEAEVGPIKYIAEFVYGEAADKNMLEEAVKWVIIVIIFVFDPLAVLLLLAAQYTFEFRRKELEDDNGERLRTEQQEFERARAQRIVDNVPPPSDPSKEPEENNIELPNYAEGFDESTTKIGELWFDESDIKNPILKAFDGTNWLPVATPSDLIPEQSGEEQVDAYIKEMEQEQRNEEMAQPYIDTMPTETQKKSIELPEGSSKKGIPDTANRMFYPEEVQDALPVVHKFTEEQLDELDNLPDWNDAKQRWKDENPNDTLKEAKKKYLHGLIDELPWEKYVVSPDLTENVIQTGYIQNQEQKEGSLWKTIGDK